MVSLGVAVNCNVLRLGLVLGLSKVSVLGWG